MQGGQEVHIDCTTIKDVETLHKSLGISVDAGGSYMGFSASAKVDYANSLDFSSYSTYVVVRVTVVNAFESVDSPTFVPDADELLINNNPDRFRQRFGDCFIAGVSKGGEYFAIYQITGSDETEKESLAVTVKAAYEAFPVGSAHLGVDINNATTTSKSHLEVSCHVFRQGAISTADLNLEDILKTAKQFPVAVAGDLSYAYEFLLQNYEILKNPNDRFVYIDIQNKQDVLEDLAKKRFEFLALRDDYKYILKHIDDFQNADGTPVNRDKLSTDFDSVVDAINTMQKQASECTRHADKCEFTKFEAAKYVLPILKSGEFQPVVLQSFVGMTYGDAWKAIEELGLEPAPSNIDVVLVGDNLRLVYESDMIVTAQEPSAGVLVQPHSRVKLDVDINSGRRREIFRSLEHKIRL